MTLDPLSKFVLVSMSFLSQSGKVWAEPYTLIQMTGLHERTLRRKIDILVKGGYLIQDDVNKFQITGSVPGSLPNNSDSVPGSLPNNSDSLPIPYKGNGNNGIVTERDTLSSKEVYPIESLQKHIWRRMQNHPGDPGAEVEAGEDSRERADWWHLLDKKKKLDTQLENLIK